MLTIFNRRELLTTYSMQQQSEARETLTAHNIPYEIKTVNRKSPSPVASGSRARTGTLGENLDQMYEYQIFVNKKDYDEAMALLRGIFGR